MDPYDQAVLFWKAFKITTEEQLEQRLEDFHVLFAYNSGKIEDTEITWYDTEEIFDGRKRVANFTGDPKALLEQQNQKLCYELLKSKIIKREPLSIDLILDVHQTLMDGIYDEHTFIEKGERPGSFKKHDYVTGIHDVGSATDNVERDVKELLEEVNAYEGEEEVLKAAAYFHARFEFIHPFADGNGRAGRSLLNYFLLLHHHPPLIIYFQDKQLYYESLQRYDEMEDLNPFYEFLKYETGKTWEKATNPKEGRETEHGSK
ncbi:Fic family protein [Caproicibacter fermentans]|uniref:Fic family protein n=1 Tax=Caproicibacter fermentans TaxID=2576756 RepID=A0A7G8TFM2_9FIRM|nr:Fic family protein [Caproicibacter fermentans]QNK42413.1 Fic family protein [Caproicibacter fermentans]